MLQYGLISLCRTSWASLVAQLVKNPPATWKTWVQSLGWEDPLGIYSDLENSMDCIVHRWCVVDPVPALFPPLEVKLMPSSRVGCKEVEISICIIAGVQKRLDTIPVSFPWQEFPATDWFCEWRQEPSFRSLVSPATQGSQTILDSLPDPRCGGFGCENSRVCV